MPFLSLHSSSKNYAYSLLPTSTSPERPTSNRAHMSPRVAGIFIPRRYARICVTTICAVALFIFVPFDLYSLYPTSALWTRSAYPPYPVPLDTPPTNDTRPPLYQRYTEYEKILSQHDESLPFPEGKHAKFVYFANHAWGSGWGNAMQEMILDAHLAYTSGRAFVFDNYTWDRDGPEYSDYSGKLIPSRIPLSALVAGPITGHPYSKSQDARTKPRSVSRHYYSQVCPHPYVLNSEEVQRTLPDGATALQVLEVWTEKLHSIEDRCVEIERDSPQLFDIWILGSSRVHDILPSLRHSPVVREFAWSPLVHDAFLQNEHYFVSTARHSKSPLLSLFFPYFTSDKGFDHLSRHALTPTSSHPSTLPVLALHLRRGDFVGHCESLSEWGSTYTGYNTLPELPDRFALEDPGVRESMSQEERKDVYHGTCLVDADKLRKRVIRAVSEWRQKQLEIERHRMWTRWGAEERVRKRLRKLYIMTNGDREWLKELKGMLQGDAERTDRKSVV